MESTSWLPILLGSLLAPPGIIVIIALVGFFLQLRRSMAGAAILTFSIALLIGLSLPITGHQFLSSLESYARPAEPEPGMGDKSTAQAIIVLGAGRNADAPEYQGDTVNALTLERLRYAAQLQRKTGLPIIVSGGSPYQERSSEAELMKRVLVDDFHADVKLMEDKSRNTLENARYCRDLLQDTGIRQAYLVTQAWHMRRAVWSFQSYGIDVIPAATGFSTLSRENSSFVGYLPSALGMRMTGLAIRERVGYFWYSVVQGQQPLPPATTAQPTPAPEPTPEPTPAPARGKSRK
jgi:uncharacterized SAM-binding protein YcdF (DUF218 family)